MELKQNCNNCDHFDGDCHCSLPFGPKLIHGCISYPLLVLCSRYEKKYERGDKDVA